MYRVVKHGPYTWWKYRVDKQVGYPGQINRVDIIQGQYVTSNQHTHTRGQTSSYRIHTQKWARYLHPHYGRPKFPFKSMWGQVTGFTQRARTPIGASGNVYSAVLCINNYLSSKGPSYSTNSANISFILYRIFKEKTSS